MTFLATLKEGALLERLAERMHGGAVRVAHEHRVHLGNADVPALAAIHPLRLHRLEHIPRDLARTPPADKPTLAVRTPCENTSRALRPRALRPAPPEAARAPSRHHAPRAPFVTLARRHAPRHTGAAGGAAGE